MDFDSWIAVLVGAFMLANAIRGYASGRFEIGWAFERVFADRSKQPFLYWFMLIGQVVVAIAVILVVICMNSVHTT